VHKINLYFDRYSFVHMEMIEEDQCLSFIMREINLLPQLYQRYVISQESCTLSAPSENYFHTVSYRIFLFISDYFAGLTCRNFTTSGMLFLYAVSGLQTFLLNMRFLVRSHGNFVGLFRI